MDKPEITGLLPAIMASAQATCPERVVDRVIGYGSFFWGGYDHAHSDIDIAVVLAKQADVDHPEGIVHDPDTVPWLSLRGMNNLSVGLHSLDIVNLERNRKITHAMPGKICARGIDLFTNPATAALRQHVQDLFANEPYVMARERYADIWILRAKSCLARMEFEIQTLALQRTYGALQSNAQAAAVFALWSVLYRHDVDPSPKALRWNAGRLATIAAMFRPELQAITRVHHAHHQRR